MGDFWAWGADLVLRVRRLSISALCRKVLSRQTWCCEKATVTRSPIGRTGPRPSTSSPSVIGKRAISASRLPMDMDLFDTARATLWKNREENETIITGAIWQNHWTDAPDGVIDSDQGTPAFGHAFKFYGCQGDYLVASIFQWKEIGDDGLFYFHRNVVNRQFTYGMFTFKDIPPEVVKQHIETNMKLDERQQWLLSILRAFIRFLKDMSHA